MDMEKVIKKIVLKCYSSECCEEITYYIRLSNLQQIKEILFSYNFFLTEEKSNDGRFRYGLLSVPCLFDFKVAKSILYLLGCKMFNKKVY